MRLLVKRPQLKGKNMVFDNWEQAQDYYYKHHQCDSDDVEKEQALIERWIESEGHTITND